MSTDCTKCGACCVAPDIAALDKPLGLRCPHLTNENLCRVYQQRPQVCRDYRADAVCELISAPTLDERVQKYLHLFDVVQEANRVKQSQIQSMRLARNSLNDLKST